MEQITDVRLFFLIPSFCLVYMSNLKDIGITQAGWYTSVISIILLIICAFFMLPLFDIKADEIQEYKWTGIIAFIVYLILNAIFFEFLYHHRLEIRDMKNCYFIIALSVIQTLIYGYFLSNLFPRKDKNVPKQ